MQMMHPLGLCFLSISWTWWLFCGYGDWLCHTHNRGSTMLSSVIVWYCGSVEPVSRIPICCRWPTIAAIFTVNCTPTVLFLLCLSQNYVYNWHHVKLWYLLVARNSSALGLAGVGISKPIQCFHSKTDISDIFLPEMLNWVCLSIYHENIIIII